MTQNNDILYLDPGHAFGIGSRESSFIKNNFQLVDQYELEAIDLHEYKCLVVHDFIDQEFMFKQREKVRSFLDAGKIVIFTGHLFKEWLPGCPLFTPKEIHQFTDYEISIAAPHTIFSGVISEEMTFNKGVAGFFARGTHSPVPAGAEVLLTLPGAMPVTYIDRQTTKGTIFVHAGRDLFVNRMQGKSTDRISVQLLQWVHEECRNLQSAGEKI